MTSTLAGSDTVGPATPPGALRRRAARVARTAWRGRETDAVWVRPAFLGLLLLAALLDVWDLAASGWANAFYSAAAQAGSTNWEAFLYGSSDAGNSITVDKPPASLWVMALSVRIFGLSAWSILLPEALIGFYNAPFYLGGTSVLIVVSVTMDTVTQIQSHLLAHQYEGLIKKSKLRGNRR